MELRSKLCKLFSQLYLNTSHVVFFVVVCFFGFCFCFFPGDFELWNCFATELRLRGIFFVSNFIKLGGDSPPTERQNLQALKQII